MRGQQRVGMISVVAVVLSMLSASVWAHPGHIEGLMGQAMHFMLDWGYLLVMVLGALIALRLVKRTKSQRTEAIRLKKIMPPKANR
jgi:hypothetical protein